MQVGVFCLRLWGGVWVVFISSFSKGFCRTVGVFGIGAVLASFNLGVEGIDVEEYVVFFEGQGSLLGWDFRE